MKVSVIVPVYNPGPYIDECVASVLRQSLGTGQVEVILVDDGSTDDSPARMDALAARHPTVTVIHQENSGWPGKPRNVGIDAARGEFVFFLDNDDTLAPEALERLVAMAERNDADVVLGRMAGFHRAVPKDLFYADRDRASLADTQLLEALTPHKLFRRSFIAAHGLRFPEGKRRLEDHPFVIRSYFLARNISVLGSYVCYFHIRRDDHSNAGLQRLDPVGYYGNLREGIGIIEEHTEPGPERDRLLTRFARAELLGRLRDRAFLEHPDDYRQVLFREVRAVIDERIPTTVDRLLAPVYRVQMALVRGDRRDLIEAQAAWGVAVAASAQLHGVNTTADGSLVLGIEASLTRDGDPLLTAGPDMDVLLRVAPGVDGVVADDARRVRPGPIGGLRVFARRRDDWSELVSAVLPLPGVAVAPDDGADGGSATAPEAAIAGEMTLDLATISAGAPIWTGTWDLYIRIEAQGYSRDVRLGAVRAPGIARRFRPLRVRGTQLEALPYWTEGGDNLSLRVAAPSSRPWIRRVLSGVRRRLASLPVRR